jgi:serine protease Do
VPHAGCRGACAGSAYPDPQYAEGLLIREVAQDSPAARAGLASGDLIVAAAGQPVSSVDDLSGALRTASDTIELTVLRGTDERSIQVTLGQNGQPEGEA